jgi:hypothetical protein
MNAPLRLALAVAVVAGGLLVVGCDGSSGSGADAGHVCPATQVVDLSTANGIPVLACNMGYVHPNVCCSAGPSQPTVCTECPAEPFGPCDKNSLTFPDPGSCCSLTDGGCTVTPSDAAGVAGSCYFPCGPGGYSSDALGDAAFLPACSDLKDASSVSACAYCCSGSIGPQSAVVCSGNGCFCGEEAPGSPPCVCYPHCGSCPAGWQVPPAGQLDLCCRADGTGVAECFSQSSDIMTSSGLSVSPSP